MIDAKEIIKLINQEIRWHKAHPGGSACGESYESGFIVGLKQARLLARRISRKPNPGPLDKYNDYLTFEAGAESGVPLGEKK